MRKILLFVIVLSFVALGCSSKTSSVVENTPEISACFVGAPEWVISGAAEGGLSAVGMANIGKAGIGFARMEALASGRDEIARMLSLKVNNMVKNFTQTTGIGDEETVDKVAASVSKQVASQVLSGSKQVSSWISPCYELYILVALDTQITQEAIASQSISSFKDNEALWQQYVAEKGQEELEKSVKELVE